MRKHLNIATFSMVVGALIAVVSYPLVLYRAPFALVPEKWIPIEHHKMSQEIAAQIKEPKQILTLAPLLALEGGCDIYPELSTGDIIYRIADSLSPDERRITRTAGPRTIDQVVRQSSPSAVIVGTEPPFFAHLEEPLLSLIDTSWHREVYKNDCYENDIMVYFKP